MRAQIVLAGLLIIAAACSRPATDADADAAADAPVADPELALTTPSDDVPVASDVEVHRPAPPRARPQVQRPAPVSVAEPSPAPLGTATDRRAAMAPAPVETSDVQAGDAGVARAPAEGGGKPTDVSTGLGPVPDRNWGEVDDVGIMGDPDPVPGMTGRGGILDGRGGVIIRGGAGGMHDDCAIHRPGRGTIAGGSPGTGTTLVNDRDPRRGSLINERAPRTSNRPALPRGGEFPGRGIR